MKKLHTILLILVLVCVLGVGVWSVVDIDPTTSVSENRELAKRPQLTLEGILDGTFIRDLEKYYSDTFPGREVLLQANKGLNRFYYFSGSGSDNLLILDHTGGAEQGGEALREPMEEEPIGEELFEEEYLADQRKLMLHKAISCLPEKMRSAVYLVYFEDLSYEEAAKVLKISKKQTDNLLQRAKNELRSILVEKGI